VSACVRARRVWTDCASVVLDPPVPVTLKAASANNRRRVGSVMNGKKRDCTKS